MAMLGQIIFFVVGIVVVGLILLFGYSIIEGNVDRQCEVENARLGTQLETLIDRNLARGDSNVVDLTMPCETVALCFVDRRYTDAALDTGTDFGELNFLNTIGSANIMQASVDSGDQTNIFRILEDGSTLPVERFSGISAPIQVTAEGSIDPAATCINAQGGVVRARLTGTGRLAQVSLP